MKSRSPLLSASPCKFRYVHPNVNYIKGQRLTTVPRLQWTWLRRNFTARDLQLAHCAAAPAASGEQTAGSTPGQQVDM